MIYWWKPSASFKCDLSSPLTFNTRKVKYDFRCPLDVLNRATSWSFFSAIRPDGISDLRAHARWPIKLSSTWAQSSVNDWNRGWALDAVWQASFFLRHRFSPIRNDYSLSIWSLISSSILNWSTFLILDLCTYIYIFFVYAMRRRQLQNGRQESSVDRLDDQYRCALGRCIRWRVTSVNARVGKKKARAKANEVFIRERESETREKETTTTTTRRRRTRGEERAHRGTVISQLYIQSRNGADEIHQPFPYLVHNMCRHHSFNARLLRHQAMLFQWSTAVAKIVVVGSIRAVDTENLLADVTRPSVHLCLSIVVSHRKSGQWRTAVNHQWIK